MLQSFMPGRDPAQPSSLVYRLQAEQRLLQMPYISTPQTAIMLLQDIKDIVNRIVDANRVLENKAAGIIVLSTAMIGFAATAGSAHRVGAPWLIIAGFAMLLAAIFCALQVGWVKEYDFPNPIVYNLPRIVNVPDNEAKICVELSEAWYSFVVDEKIAAQARSRWLASATILMMTGICLSAVTFSFLIFR